MARYCDQCGTPLDPGRRFCHNCGAPAEPSTPQTTVPMPSQPMTAPLPPMPGMRNAAASSPNALPLPSMPGAAAPMPAGPMGAAAATGRIQRKGRRVAIIIVSVVAAIALVIAAIGIIGSRNASNGAQESQSQEAKTTDKKKSGAAAKKFSFDAKKLDAIANGAQPAAVALATTDGDAEYTSSSAGESKVAAGLYLPVYLAVTNNGKTPNQTASTMLGSMDNDAANQLIDSFGGTGKINDWLKQNGYDHTELQRHYGDTEASSEGKENTTTAQDAANMLTVMDRIDAAKLMTFDASKYGITVPKSMTVYGHIGEGVKNARNFFLVIKDGDRTVSVVVMTDGQSQEEVAKTVTDLLAELHAEINPDGKDGGNQNGGSGNGSGSDQGDKGGSGKGGEPAPVQLTQTYTTQFGTVNAVDTPKLTFSYPDGWTLGQPEVNPYTETVRLTNARGVVITYAQGSMGYAGGPVWTTTVSKVADAGFDAPWGVGDGRRGAHPYGTLGQFMVAKLSGGDLQTELYALLPNSMQGGQTFQGIVESTVKFEWGGDLSFAVTDAKGGLNDQEVREVIAILASLKGA